MAQCVIDPQSSLVLLLARRVNSAAGERVGLDLLTQTTPPRSHRPLHWPAYSPPRDGRFSSGSRCYNKSIDKITCLEGSRDGSQREPFLLVLVLQ